MLWKITQTVIRHNKIIIIIRTNNKKDFNLNKKFLILDIQIQWILKIN
jgi:hypothetical protein